MANDLKEGKPVFTGLSWHRQDAFSLLVPSDWQRFNLGDGRAGVAFSPSENDPDNVVLVEVVALAQTIVATDLEALREGFLAGLRTLPGCDLEEEKHWVVGDTICLEAKLCFLEGDEHRKRWTRVFYKGDQQLTFIAQAESVDAFTTWQPMFYEALMTARLHTSVPGPQAVATAVTT